MRAVDRSIVEAIKESRNVTIILNENTRNMVTIRPCSSRKFSHDVALALQTMINEKDKRGESWR